jgi:hypothetical protein
MVRIMAVQHLAVTIIAVLSVPITLPNLPELSLIWILNFQAKRAAGSANYHAIIPIRLGLKPAIVDTSESTSLELLAGDPSTLRWLLIRWGATFSAKGHIPVVSSRTKAGRHEFFAKLASDHVCGPVVEGANAILVPKWSHTLGYHDAEMSSVFYVLVHAEDPAVYEKCHGSAL